MSVYDPMISLDVDLADSTVQTLNSCYASIEAELNAMLSASEQVIATWEGNSRVQYEAQWQATQTQLRQLLDELNRLSQGLSRTSAHFRDVGASFG